MEQETSNQMTFQQFKAKVLFSMYKRGLTSNMMAKLFGVSEDYFNGLLEGRYKDDKAKAIVMDLLKYF